MSDFGDFEPADAAGQGEPDPEALARIFVIEYREESGDEEDPADLDDLSPQEKVVLVAVMRRLIARLKQEWKPD